MSESAPPTLYDLYDRLDKLEELIEDMAELSVASAVEAEQEILKLNAQIDALEGADGAPESSA
jgi:predicted RecB family endonuclease